ncbi:hypothetical protein [Streptomyces nitrosporeus]|uniref:Uncharacterized protein n=1 Tax=Streptomyces nitrosporeus TaxID=28894 RepID=A0A5J6F7X3_9ACTN|nr:hypothetical protein [Streptomyces nitrosporeus]QEU72479.1 hypothetical protein CP967_11170 [Streptomyces nitrosporeus]GGY77576.1 hypothetical protein GCM10010327_04650 [Streptomyces nitrosporeus]
MTVDPTDPRTFEDAGSNEQPAEPTREASEADAAEQETDLRQEEPDEPLTEIDRTRMNEADAADQRRVVRHDEDDYR